MSTSAKSAGQSTRTQSKLSLNLQPLQEDGDYDDPHSQQNSARELLVDVQGGDRNMQHSSSNASDMHFSSTCPVSLMQPTPSKALNLTHVCPHVSFNLR